MKVVIIEDEKPAIEKLRRALANRSEDIEILAEIGSVKEAIRWFQHNESPDLVFMDIELSDGLSFDIFEEAKVESPVVFITAFDDYWQKAFENNGIDYLLKPFKPEKLDIALSKLENLKKHFSHNLQQLLQHSQPGTGGLFKKRFLVKRGIDFISIKTEEIAYFYAMHKLVCLVDHQNQKYILDESLADIEALVDPACFFRINRKYLVNQNSIKKIQAYPKSKLLIELNPLPGEEVLISQETAGSFKKWMDQ